LFFHLGQSIWRQIQNIELSNQYFTDSEFSLNIRKILALAYLPENLVEDSFESILQTEFYKSNEELLSNLIIYFEDTYIGRVNRRGRKIPPLFPIAIWNCYFLIEKDIPRKNNAVEGWHNSFNSLLNSVHPSIWIFINALKKENNINLFKVEQLLSGISLPKKKKCKDSAIRIRKLTSTFDPNTTNIQNYLRGIAVNFQLQL